MSIEFYRPIYDEGDIWREESWTFHSAQEVPYEALADISVTCTYVNQIHYAGPNCPHPRYEP